MKAGGLNVTAGITTVQALQATTISGTTVTIGDLYISENIVHRGDDNTRIRFPAADTIVAETGGTERIRINSDGRIAINDTGFAAYSSFSPCLAIGDSGDSQPGLVVRGSTSSNCDISFCDNSGAEGDDGVSEGLIRYEHSNDAMAFHTADSERLRIASDGVATFYANNINVNRNAGDAYIALQTSGTSNVALYGGASSGFRVFTKPSSGSLTERVKVANDGQLTVDKGAPGSSNQVIGRFQAASSRALDIVWHDSGSLMGFNTPGNHSYIFKCNDSEKLRITSTGEVKQYGFTGSADTAVDDLVIGNTDSGTNRGMTIWSHSNQNGGIAFADNDSNFRGAIQYLHAQDRLRFIAEGEEVGMWSNQRGLMVGPTSTGDSVTSKGGAKLYHLCGATPLNGSYNSSTETPLMRCGHSFNGIFQMWMLFNGDEYHKGCRQETIMCQGTYGYVSNSVRREHNQNALGAGLNSMDFGYQNSGSPNYYFKVTATWASGQNQPYILWSWTGHNSEYPYAL